MALTYSQVQAIKGGTIVGSNLAASTAVPGTEATNTFGSSSNLWGSSWTYSDINASTFGVAIYFQASVNTSDRLKVTNFGFSIPSDETIVGIAFSVVVKSTGVGTASAVISVNYVSCTITTSTGLTITSNGAFFQFL